MELQFTNDFKYAERYKVQLDPIVEPVKTSTLITLIDGKLNIAETRTANVLRLIQSRLEDENLDLESVKDSLKYQLKKANFFLRRAHEYAKFAKTEEDFVEVYKYALQKSQPILDWLVPIEVAFELAQCGLDNDLGW